MTMTKRRSISPEQQYRLRWDEELPEDFPNRIPKGRFLWHNHILHFRGMPHGLCGFRYWFELKPVNYREFERCDCGVCDVPHYRRRGVGSGTCVTTKQWERAQAKFMASLKQEAAR
jgi:hypothetical protein